MVETRDIFLLGINTLRSLVSINFDYVSYSNVLFVFGMCKTKVS